MKLNFSKAVLYTFAIFSICAVANDIPPQCMTEAGKVNLFDLDRQFPSVKNNLENGLTVTFLHRLRSDSHTSEFGCQLYFDLWEQKYVINTWDRNKTKSIHQTTTYAAALETCATTSWPTNETPTVITMLNPVSQKQIKETRRWLAEKGIAANSDAIVGRAVNAFMDIDRSQKVVRTCKSSQ
jgi:hypothetical protein